MPPGVGSHGSAGVGTIGSDSLVSGDDDTEGPLDHVFHPLVKEEEFFEAALKYVDAVLEVGFAARHSGSEWCAVGRILGIEPS